MSQFGDLEIFESIGLWKEIKLGCHDGNLGELFILVNSHIISISQTEINATFEPI